MKPILLDICKKNIILDKYKVCFSEDVYILVNTKI